MCCSQDPGNVGIPSVIQGKNDAAALHEQFCTGSTDYMGLSSLESPVLDVEESSETDERLHT